jgi:hypothetical protein
MGKSRVDGGKYYRLNADGSQAEIEPDQPDLVICRRVADFPEGRTPADAGVDWCAQCRAPIVFDPSGPHRDVTRVCMQCVDVEPLPL